MTHTAEQEREAEKAHIRQRLAKSSTYDANGCRIWNLSLHRFGHGKINMKGTVARAHRVAWELENGPIPKGLYVLHRCDVPACINVDHLFLGTIADNNHDMINKGRHAFGERNGQARLTTDKAKHIKRLHASGVGVCELARRFGVGQPTISSLIAGRTWRHA